MSPEARKHDERQHELEKMYSEMTGQLRNAIRSLSNDVGLCENEEDDEVAYRRAYELDQALAVGSPGTDLLSGLRLTSPVREEK